MVGSALCRFVRQKMVSKIRRNDMAAGDGSLCSARLLTHSKSQSSRVESESSRVQVAGNSNTGPVDYM